MKTCTRCGIEKSKDNFVKQASQKDGLFRWCKDCCREYRKANREKFREYQKIYYHKNSEAKKQYRTDKRGEIHKLKYPCVKCGEGRPYAIDFHHINPSEKEFEPSQIITASNTKLLEELKKCICLCRNCHAEFHWIYGNKPEKPVESLEEYLCCNPYELVKIHKKDN